MDLMAKSGSFFSPRKSLVKKILRRNPLMVLVPRFSSGLRSWLPGRGGEEGGTSRKQRDWACTVGDE